MPETLLAIDPGDKLSAWVLIDTQTFQPMRFAKEPNETLLHRLGSRYEAPHDDIGALRADHVWIEMIASYGMPVGVEVFETVLWIGRFAESLDAYPTLQTRHPVKLWHTHSPKAKDVNVTHALVDRFAPGARNYGKGTKDHPGFFYGFHADIWQAFALGVYAVDQLRYRDLGMVS